MMSFEVEPIKGPKNKTKGWKWKNIVVSNLRDIRTSFTLNNKTIILSYIYLLHYMCKRNNFWKNDAFKIALLNFYIFFHLEREIIAKSNPKKTEPSKLQEVAPRGQPEKSAKGKPATSGVKPSQRSQPVNGSARPSPAKSIPGTKPISKPLPGILKPNPTSKTQPGSLKTNPVSKPLQVSSKAFNVSSQKLTSTTGSEPNKKIPPTRPESPSKGRSTQVNKTDPKPSAPGVKASIPDKVNPYPDYEE